LNVTEKILGVTHPETLRTCYYLASDSLRKHKVAEAKQFAGRAAEGARKVLGPENPTTHKYEKLLADLEPKP
ncbi:MAG: hypothetical protein DME73_01670, partial [Verrucomicrobia bacterium]